MKLWSVLAAVFLGLAVGSSSGEAATYAFTFVPDITLGDDVSARGTFTTDDSPYFAMITAVAGSVDEFTIRGIDDAGLNIMSVDTLDAFFAFTATSGSVDYRITIGSGAFAPYTLSITGTDGSSREASGDLSVTSTAPSPVPLPPTASMFGAALLGMGVAGFGLRRRREAAATRSWSRPAA